MAVLYDFPENAAFGKILPKSKIYQYASTRSALKAIFVNEVEKMIWAYKLSPKTVNLPAKDGIEEVQIISVVLRTPKLKQEALSAIDKVIPSPIIFELLHDNKLQYVMAYKRPSEADKRKWVVSSYFETGWMPLSTETQPLPVALSMASLYHQLLESLLPGNPRPSETVDAYVARLELLQNKQREADKIEAQLGKEKQFNRKAELNHALKQVKKEMDTLR